MMRFGITGIASRLAKINGVRQIITRSWSSDGSQKRPFVVFKKFNPETGRFFNYMVDLDSLQDQDTSKSLVKIHNPVDPNHAPEIIASANGLLVLEQRNIFQPHNMGKFTLLNPSTGKYHIVPPHPIQRGLNEKTVSFAGFGGHKVVQTAQVQGSASYEILVYDAVNGNGEWRAIQPQPEGCLYEKTITLRPWKYGNGCLYSFIAPLLVRDGVDATVLGFDLEQEEFFEVALPGFGHRFNCRYKWIREFEGNLCLLCLWEFGWPWTRFGSEGERVDVWVLKEKRSSSSSCWTRVFSVSDPKAKLGISAEDRGYPQPLLLPQRYSACRDKVLFDVITSRYKKFAWYDLATGGFEEFRSGVNETVCLDVTSYVPSP